MKTPFAYGNVLRVSLIIFKNIQYSPLRNETDGQQIHIQKKNVYQQIISRNKKKNRQRHMILKIKVLLVGVGNGHKNVVELNRLMGCPLLIIGFPKAIQI